LHFRPYDPIVNISGRSINEYEFEEINLWLPLAEESLDKKM
jgi:hypothetical protein